MAATLKFRNKENEADKFNKVKKFGVSTATENTKRAALGDLQNREVLRAVIGKDAAQKDLKDSKLQYDMRTAKARVDSHWKKPLGTSTNAAPQKQQSTDASLSKVGVAAQRKVLTRSNSVRLGTSSATGTGSVLQRHASSSLLVGQNKPKTLTTKLVENKPKQVKYISITKIKDEKSAVVAANVLKQEPTLRREDSNLSRKSLSKLKAALSRDTGSAKSATSGATLAKATAATAAIKKDKPEPTVTISQAKTSDIKIVSVQTHSSKLLDDVEDIDAGDADNLILVSEYVNDIYNYLFSLEVIHNIRENHLTDQVEIYPKMRAVLIDWINEVHAQFRLVAETFQMAVAIIDRYLQAVKDTKRSHLQLVGVTALFIAAKYEELFPPAIADFVYITDDTYNAKQILQMEIKIMKVLDFSLARPLPLHFLRRFSKAANAEDAHHAMSKYFLELALIEYDLAHYKPSEIAAASLFLSLHLLSGKSNMATGFNDSLWTSTLEWYSRYSTEHLRPISKKIAEIARNAPNAKLKAVYTKYQSSQLLKISLRPELSGALIDSIINSKE